MPELTREQIEGSICKVRTRQILARERGDTITDELAEVQMGTLLKQWRILHDAELLEQAPTG
jgi:hypothetical protein